MFRKSGNRFSERPAPKDATPIGPEYVLEMSAERAMRSAGPGALTASEAWARFPASILRVGGSVTGGWRQFRRRYFKPWWHVRYAGLKVHYKRHLDGGGNDQGQEYLPFLADRRAPKLGRVFEWCAGPGFIGFSLLAHGFCETLCVADINEEAVTACRRTVRDNRLEGRVSVYHSDNLHSIPASEQW